MNILKSFWNDEEGLTMVEYAVAAAAIIVVAVTTMKTIGTNVNSTLSKVATSVT